jgi:hypothetical protein
VRYVRTKGFVAIAVCAATAAVGAAPASADTVVYSCINKSTGNARLAAPVTGAALTASSVCTAAEFSTKVFWSVTGPKGDTGAQGIQGEKGDKGDKGEKGDKGDTGDQGIQGLKGDQGDQGIQGEKGDKGDQGIQGLKGDKGDKGDTGAQGIQGAPGAIGPQGPAGPSGTTGATVAVGTAGNNVSTAQCAAGKVAVGGGYTASNNGAVVTASAPAVNGTAATAGQTPNSWRATNAGMGSVTAYVICAN